MTLDPDRFDSFSHQFGPMFLLFLPTLILVRIPRRILGLVGLAYVFLIICLTHVKVCAFVLIAIGPMSIAVACLADQWCQRRTIPGRLIVGLIIVILGFEASLAVGRTRQAIAGRAGMGVGGRVPCTT